MAQKRSSVSVAAGLAQHGQFHHLATTFYARVARDPVLRPLFPGKTQRCAIEELAAFLTQFFDGPAKGQQKRWWLSLRESHARFEIGPREREAWMRNMRAALEEVDSAGEAKEALLGLFETSSAYVVNAGVCPAAADLADPEMSGRWQEQCALDELVAAIRGGDAARALQMVSGVVLQKRLARNRTLFAHLLAEMLKGGHAELVAYVRSSLTAEPSLGTARFAGRTLLHTAAAAGNREMVELLLGSGADTNVADDGGHNPLYSLGNECREGGGSVVRTLVEAGADIDACDGAKRCTALHMAARRGSIEIATALLDCGAEIDARDSGGDTPLRRAVNCGQTEVAALLLARGANPRTIGSKGLTPLSAARSAAMVRVLEEYGRR